MTWEYWICLYTRTHCAARGLRSSTIAAYQKTLEQFREYIRLQQGGVEPGLVTARHVLEYVNHLRQERHNGDSAVNRQVTILKNFYRAIVAMGHLEPSANPLAHFPKMKAKPRKLPVVLSAEEVQNLLANPPKDIVLGLRDRAILALLYGTGIRASECATLTEENVDLLANTVRVFGKGGHERTIPLNPKVVDSLKAYRQARGEVPRHETFFRSRGGKAMSRNAIYERVRTHARRSRISKRVSPHTLRHTFATHLIRAGESLVTIRDLLGHRQISSTQIYLHVTAEDLRSAAANHPIARLAPTVEFLLPNVKLPLQYAPQHRSTA
jgi:site-specific recombinase XerD